MSDLTADELRRLLSYDLETGKFLWRVSPNKKIKTGKPAGYMGRDGRCRVGINGRFYKSHRLAWLYVHGRWPTGMLDHINGNPADNRISNLREASRGQNGMNRRVGKNNRSGRKGVFWNSGARKWSAQITADGRQKFLGNYHTVEDAHNAYTAAAMALHGEFANVG